MKTLLILISLFSAPAFAAICSCDAPPSCGPRPGSCFQRQARLLAGKVFVETGSNVPTTLSFSKVINGTSTIAVGYGSIADGMPFGDYYVYLTSENTFNLMLAPFNGQPPSLQGEFSFVLNPAHNDVESLQDSNGQKYVQKGAL